jgi:uncharacterized protein (DUF58 family)
MEESTHRKVLLAIESYSSLSEHQAIWFKIELAVKAAQSIVVTLNDRT